MTTTTKKTGTAAALEKVKTMPAEVPLRQWEAKTSVEY